MRRKALTLVELLVIIVIIGIVAAMLVPGLIAVSGGSSTNTSKMFSSGDRVGTVVKVSYKGNWFKAWSVEVALQGSGQIWETDILDKEPELVAKFRKANRLAKIATIAYIQPYETNLDTHYNTPYRAKNVQMLAENGDTIDISVSQKDVDEVRNMTR